MSARKTYKRQALDSVLEKMLNAPDIPEEEMELSRAEALGFLKDGFQKLMEQGYSIKRIIEYLKNSDCPVKDIKQAEILNLLSNDKQSPEKRKNTRSTGKNKTGNTPELRGENLPVVETGNYHTGNIPELISKETRGTLHLNKEAMVLTGSNGPSKGSFELSNELSLEDI